MDIDPHQDNLETLAAMRRQEDGGYGKRNFLNQEKGCSTTCRYALHVDIDIDCRDKMCDWCYQIVTFCQFRRESVEIAMSYLDRFLLTQAGAAALEDRNIYQLAAMTALYTAIKIHERQALSPKVVSQLSRGIYTEDHIKGMEATILAALDWRMNPPTTISFVRQFLTLIPDHALSQQERESILEITSAQAEHFVSNAEYISTPASTIAYCTLMNALQRTGVVKKEALSNIGRILAHSIGLENHSEQVLNAQRCLHSVSQEFTFQTSKIPDEPIQKPAHSRQASFKESPRTVSSSCMQ